jgi:hypothetical protein
MDYERIRFVTAYYSRLMGLRAVPVGLILFVIAVWMNAQAGRTRDLGSLLLWSAAGAAAYLLIDRYYRLAFGRVEPVAHSRLSEGVLLLVLSAGTVGVLRVDDGTIRALMTESEARFPISLYALWFGSLLMLDYVRTCRLAGVRNILIFPSGWVCAGALLLSALLPLLGNAFAAPFGFRSVLFLVYAVDGVIVLLCGTAGHLFLIRSMVPAGEAVHE